MRFAEHPLFALKILRASAVSALFALLPSTGCKGGDTHHSGCEERGSSMICQCPDGRPGRIECVGGQRGDCLCDAPAPVPDSGTHASFGNSDGGPPRTLPDAMIVDHPDAHDIAVDTTCGEQESQAVIGDERPVDVIFIIDNSGSMSDEIAAVERNINQNFAQIIAESGADYRVIMLSNHGAGSLEVCVEPPLASAPCTESTSPSGSTMGAPANGERFFQYDIDVQSSDSLCLMLQHYKTDPMLGPLPQSGAAASPTGWNEWLRPDALKEFVEITDDEANCSASSGTGSWSFTSPGNTVADATRTARTAYQAILDLSSEQFGTAKDPKFIWHSIVGIGDNDPIDLPYTHFDPPLLDRQCSTAVNTGAVYQMLSISTAGLRYPVCAADSGHGYDSVFRAIAHEVIRGAQVECAFNIPTPPAGKFVDYASVEVKYTPGVGGTPETFGRVKQDACNDSSFYFDDRQIKLCPSACERVRADKLANVSVVFGCGPEVELDPEVL